MTDEKLKIAISLRLSLAQNYSEKRDALSRDWPIFIEKFGGIPFPLYHSKKNVRNISNLLDGLIITGGNFDIDPDTYGEKSNGARISKNNRTLFEISICKIFLKSLKPILGICGGEQLINVACGGTLIQDIKRKKNRGR